MRIDRIRLIAEMAKQEVAVYELASKANVSRSTITSMRCGKSCNPNCAKRVAAALGVELEALLPCGEEVRK